MIEHLTKVEVLRGGNAGRIGRVVSIPWAWNLWHTWVTINTPRPEEHVMLFDECDWIVERASNVRVVSGPPY